jgi:hypothetical protein
METYGGNGGIMPFILNLATRLKNGYLHAPAALSPDLTEWEAGWAHECFGEDQNLLPPSRFEPRTVQPVA